MKTRLVYIITEFNEGNVFEWEIYHNGEKVEIWLSETSYGIKLFIVCAKWSIKEAIDYTRTEDAKINIEIYKDNYMH